MCAEACQDEEWSKFENARSIDSLVDYFGDFSSLNEHERAERLLAINPDYILAHIDEFPTLDHLDVALANLDVDARDYAFFDLIDNLSLPTVQDMLTLAEAVMDSPKYGCNYVIRYFDKFPGVDPGVIAEKILDRDPSAFLGEGKFLGFTASEIFLKLIQRGLPEDHYEAVTEEGTTQARWIRFGGHGGEVADAFVAAGEGYLIVEKLSCFSGLTTKQLREAAAQAIERCVKLGRVDTARSYLLVHQVPLEVINQRLVEQLRVDMSEQPLSPEAVLRVSGFAAWSLYYPSILEDGEISTFVGPYRKLFGPTDPEQLEKNARQKFLENLVARGVPMLTQLGWLRPDTLESLSTILPKFLESTTGSHSAWTAHEINLRVNTGLLEMWQRKDAVALRRARIELGNSATVQSIQRRAKDIFANLDVEREEQRLRSDKADAAKMAREELGAQAGAEALEQRTVEICEELENSRRSSEHDLLDHIAHSLAEDELGKSAEPEELERLAAEKREQERLGGRKALYATELSSDTADPLAELTLLRDFYRDFGIIQAPELYLRRYRASVRVLHQSKEVVDPGAALGSAVHRVSFELGSLHNLLASEKPINIAGGLQREHLEYLSGWARLRAQSWADNWGYSYSPNSELLQDRLNDFQMAWKEGQILPKDSRLTLRRMKVYASARTSTTEKKWTEAETSSYRRAREIVEQFQDVPSSALYFQEINSVRRFLEGQLQERRKWLAAEEAASPGSQKALSGREQVSRLEGYLKDLEKVEAPQRLIEFLCRVKGPVADRFKGSVVKLALCLGLERVSFREELLESLDPSPTERSVRRIYEFISNQVRDAALRPLEKDPKILHIAEKHLALPEFKSALATEEVIGSGSTGGRFRPQPDAPTKEILVLPTRGILAELAGYFSEACWTDKKDLMKDHPNATALIFMEKATPATDADLASGSVDLSDANLLGACYILRVRDTQGNDVLAIRGINPRERECERFDVESFIEGLLDDVVVPYAMALGVTRVVVPFDELGHAQTNRQLINEYLHRRYAESEYVPLDTHGPNSQFNDRLIFDKCRLVRLLPPRA